MVVKRHVLFISRGRWRWADKELSTNTRQTGRLQNGTCWFWKGAFFILPFKWIIRFQEQPSPFKSKFNVRFWNYWAIRSWSGDERTALSFGFYFILLVLYTISHLQTSCSLVFKASPDARPFTRHLHFSHNAPYLPLKILHNLCFSFLRGHRAVPRMRKYLSILTQMKHMLLWIIVHHCRVGKTFCSVVWFK